MTERRPSIDRRTAMKALGVTGAIGLAGCVDDLGGTQGDHATDDAEPDENQYFETNPAVEIPVIDAYYEGEKVWFIHTSASDAGMAERLTEMIDYPTLHAPKLADIVDIDALGDIYVFKNGVDRSDTEPWGGGPFGYQIDILDSVPDDGDYTPLRQPNVVSWSEEAEPRILTSVDELMPARDAGKVTIKPTGVVVTAPVVSWPNDPFPDSPRSNGKNE
jgi:hypothetical protein